MSKFYLQILSTQVGYHIYTRQWPVINVKANFIPYLLLMCLAFSALTLLVGRQEEHLACKKTEWWVLAWLSVWSEMQTCIWPSCHSLSLASVKSRLVLPCWYRHTRVVPKKGPVCVCVLLLMWLSEAAVH